jgi:carboxymethylenebutenolidase
MSPEQEVLHITVADGAIPLHFFPNSDATAVLFAVPSIFGADAAFEQHVSLLQAQGFCVYAIDSFWRTDGGPLGSDEVSFTRAFKRMGDSNDDECDADVSAAISFIRERHTQLPIVGLGICFGGRPIMRAALDNELQGVAAWHGIRIGELAMHLPELACPASLHFGDIDDFVPMTEVKAIQEMLAGKKEVEILVYPDCDHGFTHHGREVFNEQAYEMSLKGVVSLA